MTPSFDAADAFGALTTTESLTDAQIEERAQALLDQLTLEEKIGLMDGDPPFWSGLADMFAGGYNKHPWVAGAVPRLGIPGVRFSDGPRGIVMPGATTFPVSMARGASWDPALEERIGGAIGRELRALGGNHFGGVCINLVRHPAWGRAQETYGEDPHHLSAFGAALTRGVQGHVMACAKHYALNSMENARFTVDVTIDPRALHEVYLPHFKRAMDAGVASVMSAYNSVNGEWCGQNKTLLHDILTEQRGFQGFVLTDFVWGMRDAKKAALAEQDLEMPFQNLFHRHLKGLVERGEVPQARIDDAALRLLRQQVRFAQGRNPSDYPSDVVGCEAHRQLAREAAQKSIVLLKNEGNLLPLTNVQRVAVIGKLADMPNTGDQGSSNTLPAYVITPLQGLRNALGDGATVVYDDGSDPARAAAAAAATDVAILMLWYPGMEGGNAFADVLLGRVNPSGKLPCTFPKHAEDLPFFDKHATAITYDLWHGYRKLERDGAQPAFPFGFGLSYTTYAYSNLQLAQDRLGADDTLEARIDVTNTGKVAGEEVVQLYIAAQGSKVERAPKELKAFARVRLSPGETRTARLAVPVSDLAYYDASAGWSVEPIAYEVIIARHALDSQAHRARFTIMG